MRVFLAAAINQYKNIREFSDIDFRSVYLLESYYYLLSNKKAPESIWTANDNFLLDSGAFTYMVKGKDDTDWMKYTEAYADFINKYDIKHFFELDIDSIVGLEKVEQLRERLESLTGKRSIPVFHLSRGKQYFEWMCKNYSYVAFGGILTDGLPSSVIEKYFPWFIAIAHKNNAKIHGLGYTSSKLGNFRFDSVDSSSWLMGNISGGYCKFDLQAGKVKTCNRPEGTKIRNYKEVMTHNFLEWVKFQKYADVNF